MGGARSAALRTDRILAIVLVTVSLCMAPTPAHAWDSRTHRLITRLAIGALPESPLKRSFESHAAQLQVDAVAPDQVLRPRYGKAEAIHHYIDLENFGAHPFAALQPDFAAMVQKYGAHTLDKSGTLPWIIEATAKGVGQAWRKDDCAQVILLSGYLAHYVGDASQPLHTTKHYDGYRQDRGMHSRFEGAADRSVREVGELARPHVHLEQIESVWPAVIDELKHSNALVSTTIEADRATRAETGARRGPEFDRALMRREMPMVVRQVAEASSVLASIWLYEWKQAGSPAICAR
jgi:Zinc dependent phospholipase C